MKPKSDWDKGTEYAVAKLEPLMKKYDGKYGDTGGGGHFDKTAAANILDTAINNMGQVRKYTFTLYAVSASNMQNLPATFARELNTALNLADQKAGKVKEFAIDEIRYRPGFSANGGLEFDIIFRDRPPSIVPTKR